MLNSQYLYKLMPDLSGIAFFEKGKAETSFYSHPNLGDLITDGQSIDWIASKQVADKSEGVEEIFRVLISCGYLEE